MRGTPGDLEEVALPRMVLMTLKALRPDVSTGPVYDPMTNSGGTLATLPSIGTPVLSTDSHHHAKEYNIVYDSSAASTEEFLGKKVFDSVPASTPVVFLFMFSATPLAAIYEMVTSTSVTGSKLRKFVVTIRNKDVAFIRNGTVFGTPPSLSAVGG